MTTQPPPSTVRPSPAAGDEMLQPRIIVVEDDLALRTMLVRVLGDLGDVVAAANGEAALALVADGPRPSLILTDVMMPSMDGLELSRRLRAAPATARVPIIMLTAKTSPKDFVDGVNAGARSYMTKPFDLAQLRTRVRQALGLREPPK